MCSDKGEQFLLHKQSHNKGWTNVLREGWAISAPLTDKETTRGELMCTGKGELFQLYNQTNKQDGAN